MVRLYKVIVSMKIHIYLCLGLKYKCLFFGYRFRRMAQNNIKQFVNKLYVFLFASFFRAA